MHSLHLDDEQHFARAHAVEQTCERRLPSEPAGRCDTSANAAAKPSSGVSVESATGTTP